MSERDDHDVPEEGGRPGLPVDPLRLWHALRRGWHVVVVFAVVGAFVGAAVAKKFITQSFTARAVLRWESTGNVDPVERTTIVESVTLPSNLEVVRQRMKFAAPADSLLGMIHVSASTSSNHMSINTTWASAQGAADLANLVMDTFLESRGQAERERLSAEVARAREAVADAERRHDEAAEAWEKYRADNHFSDISLERQKAIEETAALSQKAREAAHDAEVAARELENLERAREKEPPSESTPELDESERAQAAEDRARHAQLSSELARARVQYSEDHPNVRKLLAQIAAIEERMQKRGPEIRERKPRSLASLREQAEKARARELAAKEHAARLKDRLDDLSSVEGRAAVLLGDTRATERLLTEAQATLTRAESAAANPRREFRVLERAFAPAFAASSARKRVAFGVPALFATVALLGLMLWSLRKLDVVTPKEAAFWAGVPVIGASTWPRDPDMLASLMHDLDDFAPYCQGVTLIVGASPEEAELARQVSEWDGHRMPKAHDPRKLLASGAEAEGLAVREGEPFARGDEVNNLQVLTLTGPVPAQALRRAGRLADRVLVVVLSGKHSLLQLMKLKTRLGRRTGIGILLVGLPKEYALESDRVGHVESFWHATTLAPRGDA